MKWTYQNYDVEVTVSFNSPAMLYVSPVIEIKSHDIIGVKTMLATRRSFPNSKTAEQFALEMARQWIDAQVGIGPDGNHC